MILFVSNKHTLSFFSASMMIMLTLGLPSIFQSCFNVMQNSMSIHEIHRVTQEKNGKLFNSNHASFDYKSSICSHWLLYNKWSSNTSLHIQGSVWTGPSLLSILSSIFLNWCLMRYGSWPGIIQDTPTLHAISPLHSFYDVMKLNIFVLHSFMYAFACIVPDTLYFCQCEK